MKDPLYSWLCLLKKEGLVVVYRLSYVHVWDHVFFGGDECRDSFIPHGMLGMQNELNLLEFP